MYTLVKPSIFPVEAFLSDLESILYGDPQANRMTDWFRDCAFRHGKSMSAIVKEYIEQLYQRDRTR